jgi:hypothetical protein
MEDSDRLITQCDGCGETGEPNVTEGNDTLKVTCDKCDTLICFFPLEHTKAMETMLRQREVARPTTGL